ncbi:MAG: hypothetical protein Q4F75_03395 [Pseudomonadota bacterium]|nr:hypothetical protein [Pseudomonadota bacterium]
MTTNLIATALPLVYRKDNEFEVLDGLDMNRKEELWGIQLLSGVMVALKCGPGNNVSATTWEEVEKFAENITFNGKPGIIPSQDVLIEYWGNEEKAKFAATVEVLEENEIEADGYRGYIWCSDGYFLYHACRFSLKVGSFGCYFKDTTNSNDRVAIAFY